MKRRLIVLCALTAIAAGFLLGSVQAKPIAPGFRVGVLYSASGPLYFAGAYQRAGCELAEQESNISCFYADAGDSDSEAKSAVKQLQASGVELILAPIESDSAKRVVKLNQQNPLPIIAPSSISEAIPATVKGKNWLFRLATTATQDSAALADYIAAEKPESVAILVGPESYSKLNAKLLQFGLVIRGLTDIHQYSMDEIAEAKKTNPEAVVLVSMESSIQFLNGLGEWFAKVPSKYLVQGNLANYSMYSWAKYLEGGKALVPEDQLEPDFKEKVAKYLNRPNLLNSPNTAMFGLAWRTYRSALLAGSLQNDRRLSLERMREVFSPTGYYLNQNYAIYGYRANGGFAPVGHYQKDTP